MSSVCNVRSNAGGRADEISGVGNLGLELAVCGWDCSIGLAHKLACVGLVLIDAGGYAGLVVGQELSGYPVYGRAGKLTLRIIIVSGIYNLCPRESASSKALRILGCCVVGEEPSWTNRAACKTISLNILCSNWAGGNTL